MTAALVAAAVGVAACGSSPGSPGSGGGNGGAAKSGPLKVGLIFPTSGTVAAAGTDADNGWKLYWKINGDTVAGRKIQTTYEDSAGDPTTALTKARKLVQQDGIKTIVGPVLANSAYAIAGYLKTQPNVVGLNPSGSSDDLTQRKRVKNYIRAGGWQSSSPVQPAGDWAYKEGWRKVATICNDYAFGYENCGGFVNTFTDHGGKIVKQLYPPLGTSDYSSFLSQIPKNVDGVFVTAVGADAPKFIKAWKNLGFKGKVPLITNETTLEQSTLRGIKNDDPLGLMSFGHFVEGRKAPGTKDFVDAYNKAYSEIPSYYSCAGYTAAQWYAKALKQLDGDTSDPAKLQSTLDKVKLDDSCFGPMRLGPNGGTIANEYLRKVVHKGNDLINVPVKTYKDVSQFWHYKPKAFLAQPVYSRSYQGKKWPTSCSAFVMDCTLPGGK